VSIPSYSLAMCYDLNEWGWGSTLTSMLYVFSWTYQWEQWIELKILSVHLASNLVCFKQISWSWPQSTSSRLSQFSNDNLLIVAQARNLRVTPESSPLLIPCIPSMSKSCWIYLQYPLAFGPLLTHLLLPLCLSFGSSLLFGLALCPPHHGSILSAVASGVSPCHWSYPRCQSLSVFLVSS
jgi:hypothetical protein